MKSMLQRQQSRHPKGFTIIELLVVIVIIGILSGIVLISYTSIQQRARDSQRGSDITTLKVALDKYHAEKSQYPPVCAVNTDCPASVLTSALAPYIKAIPHDPRNTADSTSDYRYSVSDSVTDTYALKVTYEYKPACFEGTNPGITDWGSISQCQ